MGPLGGTAIGNEAMEVHVGGGGGIAIATGATIGEGATTVMIVAEAITAGTTTEMIAANIVDGGADRQLSRQDWRNPVLPLMLPTDGLQVEVQLILIVDVLSRFAPVPDWDELFVRVVRGQYVRYFLRCREQAYAARQRLQFKKDLGTASLMLSIQFPNILNKLIVHVLECVSQRLDE